MQQHKSELEDMGYAFVGVSKDKPETPKKFADNYNLQFPLIADVDTSLLQTLGCWGEKVFCGKKIDGNFTYDFLGK